MIADELERYFQQRADRDAFSGVVLITQGSSQLFAGTYGYASRSWKTPNRLTTRFDTASVTKLFTAVATLQLIDQGVLAFDTTVVESLGLWDTAISREVNVYHLLTHTSGIADDAEEENGEEYADLFRTIPNYAVTETADFLPQFAYKPPNFPPGQGCRYCNCGYILLGLLIEKISGLSYRDYVRQRSSHPPECSTPTSSGWTWSMTMSPRVAIRSAMRMGRSWGGRSIIPTRPSAAPTAAPTSLPATWTGSCAKPRQGACSLLIDERVLHSPGGPPHGG